MSFKNATWNQHYISQAEQRLNAADAASKKIFSFDVVDRANCTLSPKNGNLVTIKKNLSATHLYSFDEETQGIRLNFEQVFQRYENHVRDNTLSLLNKTSKGDSKIEGEITNLLLYKLMNSVRNPYCIEKTMNTFRIAADYHHTDPQIQKYASRLVSGKRPEMSGLAAEYGVSEELYERWLYTLFMLLIPPKKDGLNLLEEAVVSLLQDPSLVVNVLLCTYSGSTSQGCPLLSDRSYVMPEQSNASFVYSFNLSSNAMITYVFSDVKKKAPELWSRCKKLLEAEANKVNVKVYQDNYELLKGYNQWVVAQSAKRVFSAFPAVRGVGFV